MLSTFVAFVVAPLALQGEVRASVTPATPQQSPVPLPASRDDVPETSFLTWRGWSYLGGTTSQMPTPYAAAGDWSYLSTPPTVDTTAPVWRTKVIVFRSLQRTGPDAFGVIRSDRQTIEDAPFADIAATMRRFDAHVVTASGGKLRAISDVSVETENLRAGYGADSIGADFIAKYLAPRINGGGYDPEDRIYRGPYQSILCVVPGALVPANATTEVHGMPVTIIPVEVADQGAASGVFDRIVRRASRRNAEVIAKKRGYTGLDEASPSPTAWTDLGSSGAAPIDTVIERLRAGTKLAVGDLFSREVPQKSSWRTPGIEVQTVTDTDKGQVLRFTFKGPTRAMGIALPRRSDGQPIADLGVTPTLELAIRTDTAEPLAVRLESQDGKRAWVTMQRETVLPGSEDVPSLALPILANNTWETWRVNAQEAAKRAGFDKVSSLAIEFSPRARLSARTVVGPLQFSLNEVRFSTDAAPAFAEPLSAADQKALVAAMATETSPDLVAQLSDKDAVVRLSAAHAFLAIKDPAAEAPLAQMAFGIDGTAGEIALRALAFQGTDTALAAIRQTIRAGLLDSSKAIAGTLLADTKDPRNGAELASLLSSRSWQTRRDAVLALRKLPNREAAIFRLAFLAQENPEIKLAVTEGIDAKDEPQVRRLLWSVVNEPNDMVRAASALKLIDSPLEELQKEGYKAVRDDSPLVRNLVLIGLANRPVEANRPALRLALADRNASVRGQALRALAALATAPSADDLAPILADLNPEVELGLIAVANKYPESVPAAVKERLKVSPFAEVRTAAATLKL